MLEAGKKKALAVERGDYHQGVPAITVLLDGEWSKRSHKHSYNANSGVAKLLAKQLANCSTLGYVTSSVQLVHKVYQKIIL